jgi:Streptomyces sporulation and cell division protein, SsgA
MSRGEHRRVSKVLEFMLVPSGDGPLEVELRYDTTDPFAVHALFEPETSEPVSWIFSRELLARGLTEPVGQGDVRIEPAVFDSKRTCLVLVSPSGKARLELSAAEITAFLDATYQVVPPGEEPDWLDVDDELRRFFAITARSLKDHRSGEQGTTRG